MTKQQSEAVGSLKIKSSNDYKASNDDNTTIILFIAFCGASVEQLNVGLSIEQQICLQEECLQMANYYEDWTLMVSSRIRLVVLNNVLSKYDESLLILKELFSECDDDSYQSTMYILFAKTYEGLKQFQNSVSFCVKWIAIAKELDDKELEMNGYMHLGKIYFEMNRFDEAVYFSKLYLDFTLEMEEESSESVPYEVLMWGCHELDRYDETILYAKKCVGITQKNGNKLVEMKANIVLKMTSTILNRSDDVALYSKEIIRIARQVDHQIDDSHVYYEVCAAYEELKQYEDAILHYKKCCGIAEQTCDTILETEVCYGIANVCKELGRYDSAILNVERCVAAAKLTDNDVYQFKAYSLMGLILEKQCQYDDAILWKKRCLDIAKQIGSKVLEAMAYSLLGHTYLKLEQYDEAILYAEKYLKVSQATDDNSRRLDISAYFILGAGNKALEKYEAAIFYFKKCVEIPDVNHDKGIIKGSAYLALGEIYHALGQYNDAVLFNEKGFELAKQNKYIETERTAFFNLLDSYHFVNRKDDALLYGNKILDNAKENADKQTEMWGHLLLADTYKTIAEIGKFASHIIEGMKIAEDLDDEVAKKRFKVFNTYLNCEVGIKMVEMFKVARGFFPQLFQEFTEEESISHEKEILQLQTKTTKDLTEYLRLLSCYVSKHQFDKALKCIEELMEQIPQSNDTNLCFFVKIGQLYMLMKKYDKGLQYLKGKADEAKASNDKISQCNFFMILGSLYVVNGQLYMAEECLREAIRYFELVFASLGNNDNFKISILDSYIDCYKILSKVLVKTSQYKQALIVLDRCRAIALRDILNSNFGMREEENAGSEQIVFTDIEPLVSSKELNILFYSYDTGILFIFSLEKVNGLQFASAPLDSHLEDLTQDNLHSLIQMAYDQMEVKDVVNCENRSLDDENSNLECSEKLYNESRSNAPRLDSTDEISERSNENGFRNTLQEIYAIMISQVKNFLQKEEIVIIPDGPLNMVPFAALQDPETGKYLSETRRIRLVPSLATLKLLTGLPMDLYSKKGALIIGDPAVGKVMLDGVERDFPPLEGARIEAMVIGSKLGVTPWMGKDATKSAVIQRLQQGVSVLHIAAHGSLSKATILLAPSEETRAAKTIPEEEDYMLTMAEVQESQVRAQLVVLSCCHSGRGEIRAEGVVGMCRAFLASGARAVVASLWAIDDDATLDFMSLFYYYLKNGKSASTSLQLTMNAMRKCESFKKPKYWAPFFLMGDDVTIHS